MKPIIKGVIIGAFAVIIIIMIFTNVDNPVITNLQENIALVKITVIESIENPFQTYSINTICELVAEEEKNPRTMTDELEKKYAVIFKELGDEWRSQGWSDAIFDWTPSQGMQLRMLEYQKWIELYDANPDIIYEIENLIDKNLPLSC